MRVRGYVKAKAHDPAWLKKFHGWAAVFWFLFAFPACLTDLRNSVPLLVFVSVYANFVGHWSSWQASRTEVKQDEQVS
jgi:hypothetical protein